MTKTAKTIYINDNIIDNRNLRPVNLSTIGGTATPTQQISLGANLPSSAPIFDPANASAGGKEKVSALIYDSLGNASNLSLEYTKTSSNGWAMSSSIPSGAASLVMTGTTETAKTCLRMFTMLPASWNFLPSRRMVQPSASLMPEQAKLILLSLLTMPPAIPERIFRSKSASRLFL